MTSISKFTNIFIILGSVTLLTYVLISILKQNKQCSGNWTGDDCDKCPVQWTGSDCDKCSDHFTGSDCDKCSDHFTGSDCDKCSGNWTGSDCKTCLGNWTGKECNICTCIKTCIPKTGICNHSDKWLCSESVWVDTDTRIYYKINKCKDVLSKKYFTDSKWDIVGTVSATNDKAVISFNDGTILSTSNVNNSDDDPGIRWVSNKPTQPTSVWVYFTK
jgi:hypothetical protein